MHTCWQRFYVQANFIPAQIHRLPTNPGNPAPHPDHRNGWHDPGPRTEFFKGLFCCATSPHISSSFLLESARTVDVFSLHSRNNRLQQAGSTLSKLLEPTPPRRLLYHHCSSAYTTHRSLGFHHHPSHPQGIKPSTHVTPTSPQTALLSSGQHGSFPS